MVLDFLAVDNFDFTRKIVKKILDEKLVKIEFLDINLTFRTMCISRVSVVTTLLATRIINGVCPCKACILLQDA